MKPIPVTVLEWSHEGRLDERGIDVTCERCAADLILPCAIGTRVVASRGMSLIFDITKQPKNATPARVQCPRCDAIYSDVREEVTA